MQLGDWIAIIAGLMAIAWVNWYFFLAPRAAGAGVRITGDAGESAGGVPRIPITVDSAYAPATIRVPAGRPVQQVVTRRDRSGCTQEVVFPDFGIRRYLPTGEPVAIDITPQQPGRYEFTCGMSMVRGTLIAESLS